MNAYEIADKFKADTRVRMATIKQYIGRDLYNDERYMLDSCNDLGTLYWLDKITGKLVTISCGRVYTVYDLPRIIS